MSTMEPLQHPHTKTKLHLTPDSLRLWSLHVHDSLSPALAEALEPSEVLLPANYDEINRLFNALTLLSPTPRLLKETQIHLALQRICEPGGGWPIGMSSRAESLLAKWQNNISELRTIDDIVWGEQGALTGCLEVRSTSGKSGWIIEMKEGKHPDDSLTIGDLGFKPGSWWVHRAAALRDGMINSVNNHITYNSKGAYAIVVTGNREIGTKFSNFEYDGTGVGGSLRLLTRMTTPPNLIRVLREYTSSSLFAPKIGLRYEGLFRVSRFSNKLEHHKDRSDKWSWKAYLERDKPKDAEPLQLARPNEDDSLVWQKFLAERVDHIQKLTTVKDIGKKATHVFWEGLESS